MGLGVPLEYLFSPPAVLICSLLSRKLAAHQNSAGARGTALLASARPRSPAALRRRRLRRRAGADPQPAVRGPLRGRTGGDFAGGGPAPWPRRAGAARRGGLPERTDTPRVRTPGECRGLIPAAVSPGLRFCVCVDSGLQKHRTHKATRVTPRGRGSSASPRRRPPPSPPGWLAPLAPKVWIFRSSYDCRSPQIQRNRCLG